jgi:hypothetical protein
MQDSDILGRKSVSLSAGLVQIKFFPSRKNHFNASKPYFKAVKTMILASIHFIAFAGICF